MQELSVPEVQTSDFAHWQREQQKAGAWEAHLDYWKQQLNGAPEALDLPADSARPSTRSGQGHWLPMHLDAASTKRLKALSTEHGTSMLAVVIAAFQVTAESPLQACRRGLFLVLHSTPQHQAIDISADRDKVSFMLDVASCLCLIQLKLAAAAQHMMFAASSHFKAFGALY